MVKFNNLGLALGMASTFLRQCDERVKAKSQKSFSADSYFLRSFREKTSRGVFCSHSLDRQ